MFDDRLCALIGTGNRIVDVGCGSGQLLADLGNNFEQRIGWTYHDAGWISWLADE